MTKHISYAGYNYQDTPQAKYNKKYTVFIRLRMDSEIDADLIELLKDKALQTEVKRLVRIGIGKNLCDEK